MRQMGERRRVDRCRGARLEVPQAGEHERAEQHRADRARELVADSHDRAAARRALVRSENDDVGIGRRLQQTQARPLDEEPGEKDAVGARQCRRHEKQRAQRHDSQSEGHAVPVAGDREHARRRQRHHEVGDVEGESDEQRLERIEPTDEPEEGDQDAVEPGHPAEEREERRHERERPPLGSRGRSALRTRRHQRPSRGGGAPPGRVQIWEARLWRQASTASPPLVGPVRHRPLA